MVDPSRTFHANQAIALAELLKLKFAKQRYGTTTKWMLQVLEPDGPSTDGGRKARAPLVLVPEHDPEGDRRVMCGWVDAAKGAAELRSYMVLSQAHQSRHNESMDLSRGEYDRFLQALQDFLRAQAVDVHFSNTPTARPSTAPPTRVVEPAMGTSENKTALLLVISFLLGFATCLALAKAGVF